MSDYNTIMSQISSYKDIAKVLSSHPELKKDREFFLKLLKDKKLDDNSITLFDKKLAEDKELVSKLVDTWPLHLAYKHISPKLQADKDIAFIAFKGNSGNIEAFPKELKDDEKFMFNLIASTYPHDPILKHLSDKFRSNKEFVMMLFKKEYNSFEFVTDELKNDPEVVWAAMFGNGTWYGPSASFPRAGNKVKADKEFVKRVLEELKGFRDKASLIAAVKDEHKLAVAQSKGNKSGKLAEVKLTLKNYKKSFHSADSWDKKKLIPEFEAFLKSDMIDFLDDPKVMILAVEAEFSDNSLYGKKECMVLKVLDKKLSNDLSFCALAMDKSNGHIYKFLPTEVKNNSDFLVANFKENIKSEHVDNSLKSNKEVVLSLLQNYPHHYNVKDMIADSLYDDKEFMKECLNLNGSLLDKAGDSIKKDKNMVEIAMSNFRNALAYADPSLLKDEDLMVKSASVGGTSFLTDLSLEQRDDKALLMKIGKAFKNYDSGYRDLMRIASFHLKKDKEFALMCVSKSGWAIENVDESIQYDKDILKAAFDTGCHVYKSLDHKKLKAMYDEKELKKIAGNLFSNLN